MRRLLTDRLLVAAAALLILTGITGGIGAAARVGDSSPGFLVLRNRVVASVGLSTWPGTAGGEIFQHEIVTANGVPMHSVADLDALVASVPVGTPIEYGFRQGTDETLRSIETRAFTLADFVLLYGMYLLNGVALGAASLIALASRRSNPAALAAVPALWVGSLWTLSALDAYGPYRIFPLHACAEALLFPTALHLALGVPAPCAALERRPWLVWALYAAGFALAGVYLANLDDPSTYSSTHLLAVSAFGAALLGLAVSEVERWRRPLPLATRERLRVLAFGALLAFSLPICITLAESLTGGRSPANALAITAWVFPSSVAWAACRGDLAAARS
jgi:hypothetical protein